MKQIRELKESAAAMEEKNREWRRKYSQTSQQLEQDVTRYHKEQSRLETLKNIAERYDGYGNSIRRVMEQKDRHKGILGVVSDLIQVEKKYEVGDRDCVRRKYPEYRHRRMKRQQSR